MPTFGSAAFEKATQECSVPPTPPEPPPEPPKPEDAAAWREAMRKKSTLAKQKQAAKITKGVSDRQQTRLVNAASRAFGVKTSKI